MFRQHCLNCGFVMYDLPSIIYCLRCRPLISNDTNAEKTVSDDFTLGCSICGAATCSAKHHQATFKPTQCSRCTRYFDKTYDPENPKLCGECVQEVNRPMNAPLADARETLSAVIAGQVQEIASIVAERDALAARCADHERCWEDIRLSYERAFPDRPWGECPRHQRASMLVYRLRTERDTARDQIARLREALDIAKRDLLQRGELMRDMLDRQNMARVQIARLRESLANTLAAWIADASQGDGIQESDSPVVDAARAILAETAP